MGGCYSRNVRHEGLKHRKYYSDDDKHETQLCEAEDDDGGDGGPQVMLKGSCKVASMYTLQGWKGANQDAMTVWKNFMGNKNEIFCGVFDGHGPMGREVAVYVRDALPRKLNCLLKSLQSLDDGSCELYTNFNNREVKDEKWLSSRNTNIVKAFEDVDEELCSNSGIDSNCSGTTAVSLVREKEHLIIANLGDSRAVLCTRDFKNKPVAVQLTVDLKPNLPGEADRIRKCEGRVFALDEEPDVLRVWLPDEDCPGLAMARAFGDFCLKDYGLISTPQITYRKLSENDDFVVLATDGVWDVLSNKEVVKIVSSVKKQCDAARQVVKRAVRAWRKKHPTSLIDDCTVICLFLKPSDSPTKSAFPIRSYSSMSSEFSISGSFKTDVSIGETLESEAEVTVSSKEEMGDPEGLSRMDTTVKLRRFASVLSRQKKSFHGL